MSKQPRPEVTAQRRFAEQAGSFADLDLPARFTRIYDTDLWAGPESRSGTGSSLDATAALREALPALLRSLGVQRLLDVPCGDFHWMRHVDLGAIDYLGGDIVEEIVVRNRRAYEWEAEDGLGSRRFVRVDLTSGSLPEADAIFCRDGLVHLSLANIRRALGSIRASGARYLMTTTFTELSANDDITDGDWRPLNLERAPFDFPPPMALLVERCDEEGGAYADKSIGVWDTALIPSHALDTDPDDGADGDIAEPNNSD